MARYTTSYSRKKIKIGLALGAGGAWALASLGVLKALEEEQIQIDFISGSSMGAIIGAAYASEFAGKDTLRAIRDTFKSMSIWKLIKYHRAEIFGLSTHAKRLAYFYKFLGNPDFSDLRIPLGVVATDFATGEEVVIKTGPVIPAINASSTYPVVFTPFKYMDRLLVDGGLVNLTPVELARNMGADLVIAVDFPSNQIHTRLNRPHRWYHKIPLIGGLWNRYITRAVFQSLEIMVRNLNDAKLTRFPPDILIRPDSTFTGMFDFSRVDEISAIGYRAAKVMIPQIRELSHKMRPMQAGKKKSAKVMHGSSV